MKNSKVIVAGVVIAFILSIYLIIVLERGGSFAIDSVLTDFIQGIFPHSSYSFFEFLSFGSGQVLLAILFLFLTGLQLIPLWNAYQDKLWVELYPLPIALRIKAFKQLLSIILSIEGVLLSFIILIKGDVLISFFSIAASLLFTFLFVTLYVNKKRLS